MLQYGGAKRQSDDFVHHNELGLRRRHPVLQGRSMKRFEFVTRGGAKLEADYFIENGTLHVVYKGVSINVAAGVNEIANAFLRDHLMRSITGEIEQISTRAVIGFWLLRRARLKRRAGRSKNGGGVERSLIDCVVRTEPSDERERSNLNDEGK